MTIPSNLLRHISLWALIFELCLTSVCFADPIRVYPELGPPAPQRQITPEKVERAKQHLKELQEEQKRTPMGHMSPEQVAEEIQWYKDNAQIKLSSNGGVFTTTADGKFFVFLDDKGYPASALTCEPQGVIEGPYEPKYSIREPNLYPVEFSALKSGSCVLRNRDFSVTIVVLEPTGR